MKFINSITATIIVVLLAIIAGAFVLSNITSAPHASPATRAEAASVQPASIREAYGATQPSLGCPATCPTKACILTPYPHCPKTGPYLKGDSEVGTI